MKGISGFLTKLEFKKRRKLIRWYNRIRTFGKSNDLNYLALIYKTDKWGKHFYTQHYDFHFKSFRNKPINLLEIGIGGYEHTTQGGGSLRMWERYFSKAKIFGLDIYDKSLLEEGRIQITQGSQVDRQLLEGLSEKSGGFDVIIDDGSHQNHHIIESFQILFPLLKTGGIYAIEDTQTSYWPEYGGDSILPDNPNTAMGYFKSFVHGLNHSEFKNPNRTPSPFENQISSIHFYHNLIFIYKGENPFRL
jgi:hypothetical protein